MATQAVSQGLPLVGLPKWRYTLSNALIITRREVRDSFRDWRIITPIIILTFGFPFVAQFLGTVSEMNVENGTAYIRPHHVEITTEPDSNGSVEMVIHEIHAAGPIARIDLQRADTGEKIESALTRQLLDDLKLVNGQRVYAKIRESSVFPK